jgi:hypothetical protein
MSRHAQHAQSARRLQRMTACIGGLLALAPGVANGGPDVSFKVRPPDAATERYQYTMTARVRPLLLFWISRSGVGGAVVTRRRAASEADYSLLIGSDPDRAPRRINRWGYIDEEVHGSEARLIGLMTESNEETIKEAEANLRRQAGGDRVFKIIHATVDAEQARSVVTSIAAPEDYSFRQMHAVLTLAGRDGSAGKSRILQLPVGTRPGFLSALAELMHRHVEQSQTSDARQPASPIKYVYHGRIYELRATRVQTMATLQVGSASYNRVIAADFEIKSAYDGELTRFSMTFGTGGPLSEVPLTISYQPRWWMQVDLALDPRGSHE